MGGSAFVPRSSGGSFTGAELASQLEVLAVRWGEREFTLLAEVGYGLSCDRLGCCWARSRSLRRRTS